MLSPTVGRRPSDTDATAATTPSLSSTGHTPAALIAQPNMDIEITVEAFKATCDCLYLICTRNTQELIKRAEGGGSSAALLKLPGNGSASPNAPKPPAPTPPRAPPIESPTAARGAAVGDQPGAAAPSVAPVAPRRLSVAGSVSSLSGHSSPISHHHGSARAGGPASSAATTVLDDDQVPTLDFDSHKAFIGKPIPATEKATRFHSVQVPQVTLFGLARSLAKSTRANDGTVTAALVLAVRYIADTKTVPTLHCVHRIFVAALWVTMKVSWDRSFRLRDYTAMTGVTPSELRKQEFLVLEGVNWRPIVTADDIRYMLATVTARSAGASFFAAQPPLVLPRATQPAGVPPAERTPHKGTLPAERSAASSAGPSNLSPKTDKATGRGDALDDDSSAAQLPHELTLRLPPSHAAMVEVFPEPVFPDLTWFVPARRPPIPTRVPPPAPSGSHLHAGDNNSRSLVRGASPNIAASVSPAGPHYTTSPGNASLSASTRSMGTTGAPMTPSVPLRRGEPVPDMNNESTDGASPIGSSSGAAGTGAATGAALDRSMATPQSVRSPSPPGAAVAVEPPRALMPREAMRSTTGSLASSSLAPDPLSGSMSSSDVASRRPAEFAGGRRPPMAMPVRRPSDDVDDSRQAATNLNHQTSSSTYRRTSGQSVMSDSTNNGNRDARRRSSDVLTLNNTMSDANASITTPTQRSPQASTSNNNTAELSASPPAVVAGSGLRAVVGNRRQQQQQQQHDVTAASAANPRGGRSSGGALPK